MTRTTIGALRELQKLDEQVRKIRDSVVAFDERLAEVEEPALLLEKELSQVQERLEQMQTDARRLERSADDKRARATKLDQRLERVANLREESAVRTELDLIRRAIEADEQEALQLMDQIRRVEEADEELRKRTAEAREAAEVRQAEILEERRTYRARLEELEGQRAEALGAVDDMERRVYDAFHASGRAIVVASLTEDGACGHCYGVVPLQIQNEIRRAGSMIRCEACGVILTNEPAPVEEPVAEISEAEDGGEGDDEAARTAEGGEDGSAGELDPT
jgi:predicted  nucleic acid-binding Zn-ribbon protein